MILESIRFGSKTIDFQIIYSERKSLGITITPDLQIFVKSPIRASISRIKEKVRKKAPWIIKQQNFFLSFHPKTPARKFISGESHLYLGKQYRLRVTLGKRDEVQYKGRLIEVTTKKKAKTKELVNEWYKARATEQFTEIAAPIILRFKKYKVSPRGLFLRQMPTRWGSCTPKGKIILNPELVKAPKPCIEYVIVHELCHLVHHDHTGKFFDLQTKMMPDWPKWKNKLERLLA